MIKKKEAWTCFATLIKHEIVNAYIQANKDIINIYPNG